MNKENEIDSLINEMSTSIGLYFFDSNGTLNRSFIESDLFRSNLLLIMNRFNSDKKKLSYFSIKYLIDSIKINNINSIEISISNFVGLANKGKYFYNDLFFKLPLLTDVYNDNIEDYIEFYINLEMFDCINTLLKDGVDNDTIIEMVINEFKLNNITIHNLKLISLLINTRLKTNYTYIVNAKYVINNESINTKDILRYSLEHLGIKIK